MRFRSTVCTRKI